MSAASAMHFIPDVCFAATLTQFWQIFFVLHAVLRLMIFFAAAAAAAGSMPTRHYAMMLSGYVIRTKVEPHPFTSFKSTFYFNVGIAFFICSSALIW
jgi:hypothetical protein